MPEAIKIENLNKTYLLGEVPVEVLQNINLTIDEGEFVTIMGPSGSGKSTLLYLMGGLDQPTSGKIRLAGTELSGLSDKEQSIMRRRQVGFVFQFYNLVPNLTVEDNILLPLLLDGKKAKEHQTRLEEIMATVELTDRRKNTPRAFRWSAATGGHRPGTDEQPGHYSGGRANRQPGQPHHGRSDAVIGQDQPGTGKNHCPSESFCGDGGLRQSNYTGAGRKGMG